MKKEEKEKEGAFFLINQGVWGQGSRDHLGPKFVVANIKG